MILIVIFFVLLFISLFYFVIRNIKSKTDLKTLSKADKDGIKCSIFIFLIMVIDIIDISMLDSLYSNTRELFWLIQLIEFFSGFLVIPALFIFVFVKLIISIKNEKKGGIIAVISLFYNLAIWLFTVSVCAYKF